MRDEREISDIQDEWDARILPYLRISKERVFTADTVLSRPPTDFKMAS